MWAVIIEIQERGVKPKQTGFNADGTYKSVGLASWQSQRGDTLSG